MWVVVKASVQLLMVIIALVVTVILDNADHFGVAWGGGCVRTHRTPPPPWLRACQASILLCYTAMK